MVAPIWTQFFPLLVDPTASVSVPRADLLSLLEASTAAGVDRANRLMNEAVVGNLNPTTTTTAAATTTTTATTGPQSFLDRLNAHSAQRQMPALSVTKSQALEAVRDVLVGMLHLNTGSHAESRVIDLVKMFVYLSHMDGAANLYKVFESLMYPFKCEEVNRDADLRHRALTELRNITMSDQQTYNMPTALFVSDELFNRLYASLGLVVKQRLPSIPKILIMPNTERPHILGELSSTVPIKDLLMNDLPRLRCVDAKYKMLERNMTRETIMETTPRVRISPTVDMRRVVYNAVNSSLAAAWEICLIRKSQFNIDDYNKIYGGASVKPLIREGGGAVKRKYGKAY